MNKLPPPLFRPPAPSKIGGQASTDPRQATGPGVSTRASHSEHRAQISTFLTKAPALNQKSTVPIYNADRLWAKVTLTLETAGPVSVGNAAELAPVLSGKGTLLQTGVPVSFTISKGNILYVAATSVNRIKLVIEPFPWLEAITGLIEGLIGAFSPAAAERLKNQH